MQCGWATIPSCPVCVRGLGGSVERSGFGRPPLIASALRQTAGVAPCHAPHLWSLPRPLVASTPPPLPRLHFEEDSDYKALKWLIVDKQLAKSPYRPIVWRTHRKGALKRRRQIERGETGPDRTACQDSSGATQEGGPNICARFARVEKVSGTPAWDDFKTLYGANFHCRSPSLQVISIAPSG